MNNIRFLSWVDVARWLWQSAEKTPAEDARFKPPEGLIYAQTYWDGVQFGVAPECDTGTIFKWLESCLGPRWEGEGDAPHILLEEENLPVRLERLTAEEVKEWQTTAFQPRFSPPRTILFDPPPSTEPAPFPPDHPPLLAVHSFKGGVGRTACTLALALAYEKANKKILLVDADFEAPGISLLFEKRRPDPDFALADLLNLLHADRSPHGSHALEIARAKVASQRLGNLFLLPCFRNLEEHIALEIHPAHLVASTAHPPFFWTDMLSQLGKALAVDLVIVDLRAGLSELSAPLLLDPRVKRLLVTTVSGQAIQGTQFVIKQLGRTTQANRWPTDNLPALIINQVPVDLMPKAGEALHSAFLQEILEQLHTSIEEAFPNDASTDNMEMAEKEIADVWLSYHPNLALLSNDWETAMETIRKTTVPDELWEALQSWLPSTAPPAVAGGKKPDPPTPIQDLDHKRKLLGSFSEKLITAEGSTDSQVDFLPFRPLEHLAQDHTAKLPIVISIGAKGAGKTYAFLNMARSRQWNTFVDKVSQGLETTIDAPILPLLWSKNADPNEMNQLIGVCQKRLNLREETTHFELPRRLAQWQSTDLFEWRSFWVNAMAWSLGFPVDHPNPGEALLAHLKTNQHTLVAIIDGLEENFPKFTSNETQQIALRALLQEVPDLLRTLPGSPLGLIVFVRQDMIQYAIPQNRTQFTERYKNYALRWDWNEALELAAWVAEKSQSFHDMWSSGFSGLSDSEHRNRLKPLWGLKLGGEKTNEATSNNWVMSVLSDLRGRIQARDVVRFLSLAAMESVGNSKTTDRLLAPVAMRKAIQTCSDKKVSEMGEENAPLQEVFEKIKNSDLKGKQVKSPFSFEDWSALGLGLAQIELMEQNGIVYFDQKEKRYHFPEIFRCGLNIERETAGARPNVLSLTRKARNQGRF